MPFPRIVNNDQGNTSPQGGGALSKIPTWVWYGVGIIGGLVIFMYIRGKSGTTTNPIQLGSAGPAGADSSMLGAPNAPSSLGITSPSGSSVNLGNVTLQPGDVSTIIQDLFGKGGADSTTNGATGGNPTGGSPGSVTPNGGGDSGIPGLSGSGPGPAQKPKDSGTPTSNTPTFPQFINVGKWPSWNGSLSGIAAHYGLSLQQVENLNPNLKRGTHNFNLIYPGEKVRLY